MPIYDAPIRDMQFLIHEMLQMQNYANLEGFADASPDVVDAFLEESGKWHRDVLAPLNRAGDIEGCTRHEDARVTTPKGFKEAYGQFCENGFGAISMDPAYGGQGLPILLSVAIGEMTSAANQAFAMYPGLSGGAWRAIHAAASEDQKTLYLPPMTEGRWTGTMNLTEPQCGTDLGLIRTRAVPAADSSYSISGQKIWISAGEHDMAENIIHLVLARIEGAPEGIKGVSLFIVPKFLVNEDGSLGARNGVSCGGLEEKMGIHGNATCVMNYDEATGFLVGEAHKGMRAMFVMMNEARLGVGLQGLAASEVAYQNALAFAKDRLQSRALTGPKNSDGPADAILVHPDVRRMLMDSKAFTEAARALTFWTALQADLATKSPDPAERERADDWTGLLTPIIKAYQTEKGLKGANDSLQVFGGSGYCEEWGMSQFVRDVRIALIYEGTNGIQALDLVGRKLMSDGGRALTSYLAELDRLIKAHEGDETLKPFVEGVRETKFLIADATQWLAANGLSNPDNAGAAAHDYLQLFGYLTQAHMWLLMAATAVEKRNGDKGFYETKLKTGQYFLERLLPEAPAHLAKLKSGAASVMALAAEEF